MSPADVGCHVRVRTWLEELEDGWHCVCGIYLAADPTSVGVPPDTEPNGKITVGPFESYEEARSELKGSFREAIPGSVRDLVEKRGAKIAAAAFEAGR